MNVFVSSTSYDLPDHRAAVMEVLNTLSLQPLGMEYWAVTGEDPVALCKEHVFNSDIFIGIYAHRLGWQPDGYDGKSITEMEYDWACEVTRDGQPIPRLCFIMDPVHLLTIDMIEFDKKPQIDAFKARVMGKHVGFFKSADDLKAQVALALEKILRERGPNRQPAVPCNLVPPPPDHFTGRADMLKILQDHLGAEGGTARVVTVLKGIGGIGKTTLAKFLAHRSTDRFGLLLWAELGETWREDLEPGILQHWARTLAGREYAPGTSTQVLADAVREIVAHTAREQYGKPVLLIIDDVWLNTLDSARLLCETMPPGARVLVTARTEDVAANLDCASVPLRDMSKGDGAALMAGLIRSNEDNPPIDPYLDYLKELSAILGGHALSLQLAARQLRRNFQPHHLIEMVTSYREGISSGIDFRDLKLDAGDTKVDSLSVSLAQTYHNLSEKRQAQFRALGVLPTDLSFRAAHIYAIWGEEDSSALDDMVAEGLLTPVLDREDQYTQHRLLRAYARALLRAMGDLETAKKCHYEYLIRLVHKSFNQPLEKWGQIGDDLPQIHAFGNELVALLTSTDDPAIQDGKLHDLSEIGAKNVSPELLMLCGEVTDTLRPYIANRYIGADGRRWLLAGLTAVRTLEQGRVSPFFEALGLWHHQRNENETALNYYEQALRDDIDLGTRHDQAMTLVDIGWAYRDKDDLERALYCFKWASTLYIETSDESGHAAALNSLGWVYHDQGNLKRAFDYFESALSVYVKTRDESGQATVLNSLGWTYHDRGNLKRALAYFGRALGLYAKTSDASGQASALNSLGWTYRDLDNRKLALGCFLHALQLCIAVGDPYAEATARYNVALSLWDQSERDAAIDHMQKSHDLKARINISTADVDAVLQKWRRSASQRRARRKGRR